MALQVVSQSQGLFDGSLGLLDVPLPFGRGLSSGAFAYLYTGFMIVVVAICFACRRGCGARRSAGPAGHPRGRGRRERLRLQRLQVQALAFTYGGVLAGLAGCLTIFYVGSFSPAGWGVGETLFTLTCVFVGGAGNTLGVLIGASVISLVFVQLTTLLPTLQSDPSLILVARGMLIPLLLILVLRFRPTGILPERLPRLAYRPAGPGGRRCPGGAGAEEDSRRPEASRR